MSTSWKPISEELRGWIMVGLVFYGIVQTIPSAIDILGQGLSETETAQQEARKKAAQKFGEDPKVQSK